MQDRLSVAPLPAQPAVSVGHPGPARAPVPSERAGLVVRPEPSSRMPGQSIDPPRPLTSPLVPPTVCYF